MIEVRNPLPITQCLELGEHVLSVSLWPHRTDLPLYGKTVLGFAHSSIEESGKRFETSPPEVELFLQPADRQGRPEISPGSVELGIDLSSKVNQLRWLEHCEETRKQEGSRPTKRKRGAYSVILAPGRVVNIERGIRIGQDDLGSDDSLGRGAKILSLFSAALYTRKLSREPFSIEVLPPEDPNGPGVVKITQRASLNANSIRWVQDRTRVVGHRTANFAGIMPSHVVS